MDADSRRDTILGHFQRLYPEPRSELDFRNEYELTIAVVLSAQCTDKKVNQVTPILFERFPDFEALRQAHPRTLESIIRPINYYRTKAKNLRALAAMVCEKHGGKVPRVRADIIELPGVGNKTANVVLGELGVEATFPVDTHVFRVAQRLGFAVGKTPEEIERQMKEIFPSHLWRNLHHWLIFHGRRVCKAQRPMCSECPLAPHCLFASPSHRNSIS